MHNTKKFFLAIALAASLAACVPMSDDRATRALGAQGYTEIQFHGISIMGVQ